MPAVMFYINTQVKAVELEPSLLVHQCEGCTSDSCFCHFLASVSSLKGEKCLIELKCYLSLKNNFWKAFLGRQLMKSPCSATCSVTATRLMFQV